MTSYAWTQLTELSQRALISLTNFSGMQILVRSDHSAGLLSELKAAMILPTLCDVVQSNYAVTSGATRRKTTLLRASVRQKGLLLKE